MSTQIVDFASLQSAVADWVNRADLTARLPDFIGLAEVRLMDELPPTRLLENEVTFTPTVGVRTVALATIAPDFREPMNLWFNNGSDREPLRFIPADLMDVWQQAGRPYNWTLDETNLAFERAPDSAYSFSFRYAITLGLSTLAPTNALLTQYPNLYLFASLVEASPYLKDKEALALWEVKYQQALSNAKRRQSRMTAQATLSVDGGLLANRYRTGFNINRGY